MKYIFFLSKLMLLNNIQKVLLATSGSVMVSKLDWRASENEFESYWMSHPFSLVLHKFQQKVLFHYSLSSFKLFYSS